ncbi:uncharacterized protein KY384_005243 [Bacidia gigantensis]|uniref:uncharacterized protein n=1 Tax=Bacidia gigantensis TaxID=2732470 RepID=UPI001D03608B|nr:uncharacterized protein KY384_005243 [Bacidia gigantensis]KAG8529762.1 hypothetical protein KY384_005243 [Bacidia gigantensis]
MSSPPRSGGGTSPTYPSQVPLPNNPRKRPSLHLQQSHGPQKRRKQASIASGASSAHPLRQTSFPPNEIAVESALLSPSVESDITGFTGDGVRNANTATSAKGGRKRGKKGKREVSASVKGRGAQSERSATGDIADEEDEDEDGGEGLMDDGGEMDKAAEKKNLSVLVDAFSPEQAERYEMFRRVKLKKETVRKIANFTLAQSVPPAVITTINGYTKTFVGTLIERAREVQQQWAVIETPPATPGATQIPPDPPDLGVEKPKNNSAIRRASSGSIDPELLFGEDVNAEEHKPHEDLGPLLPDHLREALRRYRRDGEANSTGLTGFSVGLGVSGTGSARLQGRRLFR